MENRIITTDVTEEDYTLEGKSSPTGPWTSISARKKPKIP